MAQVEEPILESAPLARKVAPRLCHKDPETGESCSWYHGFWQYLRALGLITTPEHHADFLRDAFALAAATSARPRILISGAADYSTFAYVLWACRQHGAAPEITVIDVCETPLYLTRWYAQRIGYEVATSAANALDFDSPVAFDAICTHSFFGRFLPAERRRLLSRWNRLLRPGGLAIAVNRLRRGADPGRVGFSPEQASAFREAVTGRAETLREKIGADPDELGRQAQAYAARHRVHPLHSQDELRELFEGAGLGVERLTEIAVSPAGKAGLGGPTTLEGARYACVVARKAV